MQTNFAIVLKPIQTSNYLILGICSKEVKTFPIFLVISFLSFISPFYQKITKKARKIKVKSGPCRFFIF